MKNAENNIERDGDGMQKGVESAAHEKVEELKHSVLSEVGDVLHEGREGAENKEKREQKEQEDAEGAGEASEKNDETDVKLELTEEEQVELEEKVNDFRKERGWVSPCLLKGRKTAKGYDFPDSATNWSTVTEIVELTSGEKVFVVYNHPGSLVHRLGDGVRNMVEGTKFFKAISSDEWIKRFKRDSNIPVLWTDEERVVVLPYIESVNLSDLFGKDDKEKNWEGAEWVEEIDQDIERKYEILKQAVDQINELHKNKRAWGSLAMDNMILSKDGEVIICDPETMYKDGMPEVEQKARDLREFVLTTGQLVSGGDLDKGKIVEVVFEKYEDEDVLNYLQDELTTKTLGEKLFSAGSVVRYGGDSSDMDEMLEILREWGKK